MKAEAGALLPKVEESLEGAVGEISKNIEGLADPFPAVWDGAGRVWTLRRHEPGDPVFVEVVATVTAFPVYGLSDEAAREVTVEITARAWSTQHRHASQERQVYAKLMENISEVPDVGEFQALLERSLDKAEHLAKQLPEATKQLDAFLEGMPNP
ncbi:hypothetical protein [Streptomyces sp. NBC_01236]|uniref:hypothetical protein n=1 Tax=Streptomyces sp. NBC_01236 TaxID=2903789 RepID=UPI002E136A5D|nr:hypothetical protein OG324_32265 [Streptomyces sp. NBC_01236]